MIPQETVDRILELAQIEDVIGDFMTLKRAGATYKACCPFHNEKTPSFVVSPSKGIYKCFGCGKAGTAVNFVMEHESMTYVEALKYLAKKYNVEIVETEESAEDIAKKQRNESLMLVSAYASEFFCKSLMTQEGQTIGYQYFKSRGLEDETIRKYGLGWAPVDRSTFTSVARSAGYKEEYLLDTGLCKKYDDGRIVDTFHDRVIFPIHSVTGRVIAFGGRTLKTDKNIPKYVNSKETEIYVKSKSLYGIYFAKNEIARRDKCILVEGYLDVLSMHQLGLTNVVASSGTSLTVDQIRLIRKFSDNVTIIYDGDGAGIKAALRGIDLVLKEGLNVKVVLLPDGQDPDDFAKRHSYDQVVEYITDNERDFIDFKTELLLGEAGNDPLKRANLINDISDTIAMIPDAIKRAVYVKATSQRFEIDESILADRIAKSRSSMLLAEKKQRERDAIVARQDIPPVTDADIDSIPVPDIIHDIQEGPIGEGITMNEPYLASCERELLYFILEHGCSELQFDNDSKYYEEGESVSVADFIDGGLAEDEIFFMNTQYHNVYELYFTFYQEGLSQDQIKQRLLNSEDQETAAVSRDILIKKYELSVDAYQRSMTSEVTWLAHYVPKSLMAYQCRRLEYELKNLTVQLEQVTDLESQMEIMQRITSLNKLRTKINNELGRV